MTTTTIESALRRIEDLPVPVHAWRIEAGPDATDDAAVWVWVTLEDKDLDDDAIRTQVRDRVREAVRSTLEGVDWVYVRFRAVSEVEDT